ncbi:hypothetical protein CUMW_202230 [Citrus unshiu]|nr:hypothetical protein CUMW_202230 [Citrus unshiu]
MEEASCAFHCALDNHLLPDVVTYAILIRGYCKAGRPTKAMQLYNSMLRNGIMPDGLLLSTLAGYNLQSSGSQEFCT